MIVSKIIGAFELRGEGFGGFKIVLHPSNSKSITDSHYKLIIIINKSRDEHVKFLFGKVLNFSSTNYNYRYMEFGVLDSTNAAKTHLYFYMLDIK